MATRSGRHPGTSAVTWSSSDSTRPTTRAVRPDRRRPPARIGHAAPARIFQAIWECVARIPRGRVATYGQISRMVGLPGGARTVGWAMGALPDGLTIGGRPVPWHRVINAQGRISPRRGGLDGGQERQASALRREGTRVAPGGAVDLRRFLWTGPRRRRAIRSDG